MCPQGCFAPDNLQSALIVSFSVPETCKKTVYIFINCARLAYLLCPDFLSEGSLALIRIKNQTLDHTQI